jgi:hypothetical protein
VGRKGQEEERNRAEERKRSRENKMVTWTEKQSRDMSWRGNWQVQGKQEADWEVVYIKDVFSLQVHKGCRQPSNP